MRLEAVFRPKSVAIIGASRSPRKVGHAITKNMVESGFRGKIYPINPNADNILGLKCYPSVLDVPFNIDLAAIAVPAATVPDVAEECGKKGVKAVIVVSAGFKETGREGARLEKRLTEIGAKYGMKIQGPNCLGVIDTSTPLNLTFAAKMPTAGSIGFISQSGALGTAILDWAIKEGIGLSRFVSLGNKADLDEVDFIEAMGSEDGVRVILLYIESIERGQRFIEVTRRVFREKPVVVLKGGTSSAGARAAGSHTGALVGSFIAYKTAFNKSGVIYVESLEELFDFAIAFTQQPMPIGGELAIVTNAGGPGILATDICEKLDVNLARISQKTRNSLREGLPEAASISNPIDVLGDAREDRYRLAVTKVLEDDHVDAVVVITSPQVMTDSMRIAETIVDVQQDLGDKPILAVFMGGGAVDESSAYLRENNIPSFNFPEKAIKTVAALFKYANLLRKQEQQQVGFRDLDPKRVEEIFESVRRDHRAVLLPHEAADVVRAYGIASPRSRIAQTAGEAVRHAQDLGYPIVLKIVSPDILHKTDIGGVVLNLDSANAVRSAFEGIISRVKRFMTDAQIYGVMVYKMIPEGKEMIIGMSRDVQFGPLVMFGLGGIYVNLLRDISFRIPPLSERDVYEMVQETKAYTLLKGIRGENPSDVDAVVETILRVGQLAMDFPQIVEMDINPVIVYEEGKGCIALDVKIILTRD